MSENNELYQLTKFFLMTLDPVHIGTGGNRLGRVDNSIVREPGTRLPKIPGTSLSGAIRQYAAYRYESRRCAGTGQGEGDNNSHCKDNECPICYTFGYMSGQEGGQSGTVNIGDARLLLFPVYSLAGPVWITCPSVLNVLNEFGENQSDPGEQIRLPESLKNHKHLNLGWLMLEKAEKPFQWPEKKIQVVPDEIENRTVLISDKLFSHVVNSNLEVRTSVSIDPETGAATEKALFTYEAIPRAALLWMDVVEDNYRKEAFKTTDKTKTEKDFPNGEKWEKPIDVVQAGLKLIEYLGIGGMGTRGFGRVRLLNAEVSK